MNLRKHDSNFMRNPGKYLLVIVSIMFSAIVARSADPGNSAVPLDGSWRFQLDREDAGQAEAWFKRTLSDTVRLPGDLSEQGIGDPVTAETKWIGGIIDKSWFTAPGFAEYRKPGNVKVPFWLQPERYYAGAAWYQRDVDIPAEWEHRRVVLFLERPHWETRVWLDGQPLGTNNALGTPHEYDLGGVTPGQHSLTIRVDNRLIIDIGENSHSVSDHTQGNWNGVVGRIELRATPLVWLDALRVYPEPEKGAFRLEGRIGNHTGKPGQGMLHLGVYDARTREARIPREKREVAWDASGGVFAVEIKTAGQPMLWDEFNPRLYEIIVALGEHQQVLTAGLRRIGVGQTQFTINGREAFFRGTLECAIFPKTGHPPTDTASWRRVMQVAQAHGLNLLRFHSWCPPEAAFVAADELGVYLHVEASSWANQSTTLGDGKPVDRWIYDETDRILRYYGNHPSFVLMLYGNEPGGGKHKEYLAKWVEHYRAQDSRRLYSSGAGWPQLPENQFHVTPDPRVQAWGAGLKSRINAHPPETVTDYREYIQARNVPVISHEIGQWCVYPNFDEMAKYTGYLKPRNFEIFQARLNAGGMGGMARDFLRASGKLQALCYKEDIESALRTPGMGGFELLDLHDFPGQGTALVGVLDPFWEEKGYISAREFRRFCNQTVPLARLSRRVFTVDQRLTAELEVTHFGAQPLKAAVLEWTLSTSAGKVIARGDFPARELPRGNAVPMGNLDVPLSAIPAPAQCKLTTRLRGTEFENAWDLWIYPAAVEPADAVLVTSTLDDRARAALAQGGKVLLTIPGPQTRNFDTRPVKPGFSTIFWNTAWTARQPPTTLGIWCDPRHPALADFPTDFHSNWQWWYLTHNAGALRLDLLPAQTRPVVRLIDDWVTARPLGLIVEGKVGEGGLIVCGFDLTQAADPVSRQMRASLSRYLASREFAPATEFSIEQVQSLIRTPGRKLTCARSVRASSEAGVHEAANAIDGDPQTMWHTPWGDGAPGFPHELTVELDQPRRLAGLTALPRQDGNRNGWIKAYEVLVSMDGQVWGQPVARGEFSADDELKTIRFSPAVETRYLKLRALSGYAKGPYASLAELDLLPEP